MAQPGYPDYSRTASQSGNQLIFFGQNKAAGTTSQLIDCIGYAYVEFEIQDFANPGFVTIKVNWFSDNSNGIIVASQYFTPTPACNFAVKFPALSRYMSFTISLVGAGQSGTTNYFIYGSNTSERETLTAEAAAPFIRATPTIGAGSSSIATATQFYTGEATCNVGNYSNGTWFVNVEYYDKTAVAWQQYLTISGAVYGQAAIIPIRIPPAPIRLNANNTDTVSRSFLLSIVTG